jgi:hypothetical protein
MNENKSAIKQISTNKSANLTLKRFKSQDVYNTFKRKSPLSSNIQSTSIGNLKNIPEKKEISMSITNKHINTEQKNFSKIINDASIQELDTEENSNQ